MDSQETDEHLSRIKTRWSLVFQAHQAEADAGAAAQRELLLRYYGAVYRYFRGMLRDAAAAGELTNDFAVRFLRGDFRAANPQRGRFRDFLKVAMRHLVIDHWRHQAQHKEVDRPLPNDSAVGAVAAEADADSDAAFLASWREELLARTWEALNQFQQESGSPYHVVLRHKTEKPQDRAAQLAKTLTAQLGRPFTETGVRQVLKRARDKFADLLLDEVARSLPGATPAELEQELIDLGLLEYCKSALERRGSSA